MVRNDWPYLNETKPGMIFIRKRGIRTRVHLPGPNGTKIFPTDKRSPQFASAYLYTLELVENPGRAPILEGDTDGTFNAIITEYRAAPNFTRLKPSTKRLYNSHLEKISAAWGALHIASLRRKHIIRARNKLADTPRQADVRVNVINQLIKLAIDLDLREDHPGLRIPRINKPVPYPALARACVEAIHGEGARPRCRWGRSSAFHGATINRRDQDAEDRPN